MSAYRYFKFVINTYSEYANFTRLTLYENETEFTLTGATATADSTYVGSPIGAFDGSQWHSQSNTQGHWLLLDLGIGQQRTLTHLKLEQRTDAHLPRVLTISGSTNNIDFEWLGNISFENYTTASQSVIRSVTTNSQVQFRKLYAKLDVVNGGAYQIKGTVTEIGVPGRYKVRLFLRKNGVLTREIWSEPNGVYIFTYLAYLPNGYFAIAFDHGDNPLNAAIADFVTPEPMP